MSYNPPPGGAPPPYYAGGPYPPPPGGGYAYVPTPVMMPMPMPMYPPPPQPEHPPPSNTYVTNHIYHPPDQVHIVDGGPSTGDMIDWIQTNPTTARNLSARAVVAGHEGWDGSPLWVIRARYGGDCIPGKLAAKHNSAFIAHGGKEIRVYDFEVMVASPHLIRWLPGANGSVPPGAIPAGNTAGGEPLYIGRVGHLMSLTPGKVHCSHGSCYISFGGTEIAYRNYEVLCSV